MTLIWAKTNPRAEFLISSSRKKRPHKTRRATSTIFGSNSKIHDDGRNTRIKRTFLRRESNFGFRFDYFTHNSRSWKEIFLPTAEQTTADDKEKGKRKVLFEAALIILSFNNSCVGCWETESKRRPLKKAFFSFLRDLFTRAEFEILNPHRKQKKSSSFEIRRKEPPARASE